MRRLPIFFLATSLCASLALAFVACSDPAPVSTLPVTDDDEDAGAKRRDSGRTDEVPDGADPPLPDGGKPPGRIYAHDKNTLYRFDPLANTLVEVGVFGCVPQNGVGGLGTTPENDAVIDLALDRTGQMYATTYWRFIKVDATSGACQVIRTDTRANMYPNSLSFVPAGTIDPTQEALVGYAFDNFDDATIYTRIDLQTGEMTDQENLNPTPAFNGLEYGISGDFISLVRDQGRTYAAIKQVTGDAGAGNDLLAEVDPKTGTLLKIIGDTGQKGYYGMGFWAGKAYGFTVSGDVYEVDIATGSSTHVLAAKDKDGAPIAWFGAGVTTDSPTAP
ncbi:MAG: hypothetical protein KIS78_07365 [Labilithrix sp.]|nr:hypothetical protein [Labilithrix sp.]MCW5832250.1 hypothetical protein [Labilithrix sp.]